MIKIIQAAAALLIIAGTFSVSAQEINCKDHTAVKEKLKAIHETDQQIRSRIKKEMPSGDVSKIKEMALEMKASDKQNQLYISQLLDQCGWPEGLTAEESSAIFLVIDHADIAFMQKYLPVLESQAQVGNVSKSDLATIRDRVQMLTGKKQAYGTQTFKVGNEVYVWPVDQETMLDDRRKEMGLPSMQEYIGMLNNAYKSKVIWDKQLTVEEAASKMAKKTK
ncbi:MULTISPECIES: DUF6624 domain-containing protein [Chryseobacterium]|uniref:Uncharacterized protein n=1 Tax=Chryseobacterium camelliae TaxID=1265445 RepID=A0ABU0TI42_9FLAO|nr:MULTISPECIES: DUF6624 domain-containing protein [Chryseobacterium]MDT3409413.1 hypothetical protein [Pseudacidovorax intermedius]MDQ1096722.1 hypothetical protein [Chryseobacterium camelliae]MDQ1100666.1 hypothetical protein [Chryseobacterium sp. SORGH_AS_1048]MDR6088004.1 hypothetical protein [Chryseobacterium sp. SORGH_AS_0909]MDR6132379.1 hypothetical protein [Chryseobacterium sp. SORGH_AS_1175]